jgi:hypothetical protein
LAKIGIDHDDFETDRKRFIFTVTEADRSGAHRFYESLGYQSKAYKGFKKKLESGQRQKSAGAKHRLPHR